MMDNIEILNKVFEPVIVPVFILYITMLCVPCLAKFLCLFHIPSHWHPIKYHFFGFGIHVQVLWLYLGA